MSQQQQLQFTRNYSSIEDDEHLVEEDEAICYSELIRTSSTTSTSSIKCSSNSFNPNFYNPFEIKHRRRTSRGQFKILEREFADNPKPNSKARKALADTLSMSPRGVQVWFQNRRAKAKQLQQQENDKKSRDNNMVEKLQVSSSSPIILSSPGMIHSRSQSSSSSFSSSTTFSATANVINSNKNDFHVMLSSAASLPVPPPQPQVWYNNSSNSDTASTVTITSSSPLLLTPPQTQLDIVVKNEQQQDGYCLWMDNVIQDHQTALFNIDQQQQRQRQVVPAAGINEDTQHTMKSDLFTAPAADNTANAIAGPANQQLDSWAYNIDSLAMHNNQQYQDLYLETSSYIAKEDNKNIITYNRHVADWISSTRAACSHQGFHEDLLFMLDIDHSNQYSQQQQHQYPNASNKPFLSATDNRRRRSYPPLPFAQQESYWTTPDQQIMRRDSESKHYQSSELELINSCHHYSVAAATL